MISRKLIEDALTPRGPQGPQVSLRRGEVVAPGMVSTEPDDLTGSPVDGPAIDGSGAVLTIDGHRVFIPYAPSVPQALAERVEQAVQQATTAQEATNSTHVVAESAASTATAAVAAAADLSDAMEARDATIATIQDDVEDARQELAAAHGLASQASLDAADANNAAVSAAEKAMTVALSGANLILNGGFEQVNAAGNPVEWPNPGTAYTYPSSGARSGTRRAVVTTTGATLTLYQSGQIPSTAGRSYYMEGWVRLDSGTQDANVALMFAQYRADGTVGTSRYITVPAGTLTAGEWTKISGTLSVAQADTATIRFGVRVDAQPNLSISVDDLFAVDVTEAQSAIAAAEAAALESAAAVAAANSAITNVVPEYARNTSETDAPTSGWTTNPPGRLPGTFIWRRDRVTYGDGSTNTTLPVLTTGNTGPAGADGTSVAIKGRVATSSALPTTGVTDGDGYITEDTGHLWVRSGTTWIDAGLIRGPQGEPGSAGSPGADGVSVLTITPFYRRQLASEAAPARPTTMAPPSGWVTTEPEWQPLHSLYRTERIVYSDGDFTWTLVSRVAAWEVAGQALTSANGKNSRITRTAAPTAANTTNPVTGGELVTGDTWWQVDSMTTLNAVGAWEWSGSDWVRTGITSEVITNLDVLKLTVSGSAQVMQLDVVDKIISDAAHHRLLTAERLVIMPGNTFPDPNFQNSPAWDGPYASVATDPTAPGGSKLVLTGAPAGVSTGVYYNGQNARDIQLEAEASYRITFQAQVGGDADNVDNLVVFIRGDKSSDGAVISAYVTIPVVTKHAWATYEAVLKVPTDWAGRGTVGFYYQSAPDTSGAETWFADVSMLRMVGGVLIEDGAITADMVTSGSFAGKTFTGGTFTGSTFRTAASGQRVQMDATGLTRWRSDGEGGLIRSINIGGSDADELALYDGSGRLLSGLMSDGSGVVRGEHSVGSLRVGGDRLEDLLDPAPKGVIALYKSSQDSPHAGSSPVGLASLIAYTRTGRLYRLSVSGMLAAVTAGDQAQLSFATWQPEARFLQYGNFSIPTSRAEYVYMEQVFPGLHDGSARFGVRYANVTANRGIFWSGRNNYPVTFMLEDLGAARFNVGYNDLMGGTPIGTGTTTDETPAATQVVTYNAAWTRSWRGSTVVSDFLHHGYYGGLQRYSMVGFPAQMATDLAGATIQKVEVYLDNQHWWSAAGGTALIGRSTATSAPSSPQTSGGSAFATTGWPVGQARWVTAPAGWWSASHRAITLGEGAGTSTTNYGKFTNALSAVKLRVTYSK